MNKSLKNDIEEAYRKLLYKLFDIPIHSKYESVLMELGLKKAKDIIASLKICYMNRIWNEGLNPMGKHLLINDHKCKGEEDSVIEEIEKLCEEYKIGSIFKTYIDNEIIKERINKVAEEEIWKSNFMSTIAEPRESYRHKPYHYMTRGKGRIVLLWRIGSLRFRSLWKNYYTKHNQSYVLIHYVEEEMN